jgi:hypothetical protein
VGIVIVVESMGHHIVPGDGGQVTSLLHLSIIGCALGKTGQMEIMA